MTSQRFPIRVGRRSQLVLILFGVRPANAYVDLGRDELDAHFGFFRFRTATSNIASCLSPRPKQGYGASIGSGQELRGFRSSLTLNLDEVAGTR